MIKNVAKDCNKQGTEEKSMQGWMKKGMLALAFGAAAIGMTGCSTQQYQDQAQRAVENMGFSDVKVEYSTSATLVKCGQDDDFGWKFQATNPAGKHVEGYVCNGIAKGSTVRFE